MTRGAQNIAKIIDHTLLRPEASATDYDRHFNEAIKYQFFSVCVPGFWIPAAQKALRGSNVKICTVVGFPFGYQPELEKAFATELSIKNGADEIDMVINISSIKSGNWPAVEKDISAVVKASEHKIVKVILETSLLTDHEKIQACKISESAGAQFVKTSTGFSITGATVNDVTLMKKSVSNKMQIKASGGIRDLNTALSMVKAGATRIGTNSGVAIITGSAASGDY